MRKPSDPPSDRDAQLAKIVGFGESSMRKSYYPELRRRLTELETANQALAQEIKLRKQGEETLRKSEHKYRRIVETSQEGIVAIDERECITFINRRMAELLGYEVEELLGRSLSGLMVQEELVDHDERMQGRRAGQPERYERRYRRKDGREIVTLTNATPLFDDAGQFRGSFAMLTDLTERKQLEMQLRTAQKMEAVGQLAGGVAHDFNNILTAILGNVEMAMERLKMAPPSAGPTIDGLRQIERSAQRAAGLTRQLLAFSRRQIVQPQVLNINDTLAEMEKMLQRLLTENITLEVVRERTLRPVRIDPGQFEQVVMNLVVNARDAMPDGGTLTLETENTTLDEEYVRSHAEAQPGPHVVLRVSDTGCGMDAKVIERIFEPFFTTKAMGQGTGLGLAMVYGAVKQAGGHILVYSELGHGSTFKVYLPAVLEAAETRRAAETPKAPAVGTETILLCEDAQAVRELTTLMLESAGYTVLTAENGAQARRLAGDHRGLIQLLITDVIMPDTNGKKLADELLVARPDLRVLFVSGYTSNVIAHHGALDPGVEFLQKPFTRASLLRRVREVLDRPAATACPP